MTAGFVETSESVIEQDFVYTGWNLVAELDQNMSTVRTYTWGTDLSGSMQGAGGVGGLLSMTDHTQTESKSYYYAFDGNGNVEGLIDSQSGSLVATYDYTPFGQNYDALTDDGGIENPFRFSTKYLDEETELYYYGYRFYDAGLGRWLSRDPIEEFGGWNVYGFVRNDSVNYFDVLGLSVAKRRPDPEKCRQALHKLWHKAKEVSENILKYDPKEDGKPHKSRWAKGGYTKPGSHYRKIKKQQRELGQAIKKFIDDCFDDCDGKMVPRSVPKWIDKKTNEKIPEPIIPPVIPQKKEPLIPPPPWYLLPILIPLSPFLPVLA